MVFCFQIIMPSTTCEGGNVTVLFKMVSNMVTSANIVTVHRKYFNEAKGIKCCNFDSVCIVALYPNSAVGGRRKSLLHTVRACA